MFRCVCWVTNCNSGRLQGKGQEHLVVTSGGSLLLAAAVIQLCCAGLLGLALCGYLHLCVLVHRHDLTSPAGAVGRVLSPSDISMAKLLCLRAALPSAAVTWQVLPCLLCPVPGRQLPVGKVWGTLYICTSFLTLVGAMGCMY